MSHCVPDWDASTGELDATIPLSFGLPLSNSKPELQQHRKIDILDVANVPDHEFRLRASNPDGGVIPTTSQPYGKIAKHASGHLNFLSNFTQQIENTNWTRTTSTEFSRDGSFDSLVNSVVAGDPACSLGTEDTLDFSVASIDEDMLAYLYPLDNPLDRSYSMDTLREPPNSQLNFHKGSSDFKSCGDQLNLLPQNSKSVLPNKSGDVVMGLDARRSAGFKLTGEVLEEAGCILPEPLTSKGPRTFQANPMDLGLHHLTFRTSFGGGCQSTVAAPPPMLLPRWQSTHSTATFSSSTSDTVSLNFAHFSRPAALAKASLQTLGICGSKDSDHLQRHSGVKNVEENVQDGASLTESTSKSHILSSNETSAYFQGASPQQASSGQPNAANCELSLPSTQETVRIEEEITRQNGNTTDIKGKSSELGKQQLASVTGSTPHGDKSSQSAAEVLEAFEPTTTTSLACSGNTAERTKKRLLTKGKKKPRELDDPTECQSQNSEDDSVELKKPVRGSSSKRTRAAEVHNLSERRRRDRINEKMKALQELIPNSNKTDKASMLDEAIEYLKMLQLQLQMMSIRSGLSIPPVLVSAGMQPMQIPQMAHLSGIGMGRGGRMGMGMGMGMGMMDMGSGGSGRPLMFFPSPGSSHLPTRPPTIGDVHERLSGPAVVDFYNRLVTGQQLQVPSQPINMNMYHPYMLQQWQQHQIHSQQVHDHLQPSSTAACGPPR